MCLPFINGKHTFLRQKSSTSPCQLHIYIVKYQHKYVFHKVEATCLPWVSHGGRCRWKLPWVSHGKVLRTAILLISFFYNTLWPFFMFRTYVIDLFIPKLTKLHKMAWVIVLINRLIKSFIKFPLNTLVSEVDFCEITV